MSIFKTIKIIIILNLYILGLEYFQMHASLLFKINDKVIWAHLFWTHISISDLADFILAVTGVRIGTMGAVLASCRVRQSSLMSMSVRSASQQRMPWQCSRRWQREITRVWRGCCALCRWEAAPRAAFEDEVFQRDFGNTPRVWTCQSWTTWLFTDSQPIKSRAPPSSVLPMPMWPRFPQPHNSSAALYQHLYLKWLTFFFFFLNEILYLFKTSVLHWHSCNHRRENGKNWKENNSFSTGSDVI